MSEPAPYGLPEAQAVVDALANPPGLTAWQRQVAPHALALARMRERLAEPGRDLALRSLARGATDEPAIALLDAWAVVADTVSFYSERHAAEGFLRTAVQRGSVRELARTLGYELRPGVAAQVDLAFTVETAGDPPEVVVVPAGTPVQSIPGPGQLPQTFETGVDLEARGVWNAIPAVDSRPQTIDVGQDWLWVRGTVTTRPGDLVLVARERGFAGSSGASRVLGLGLPTRSAHTVTAVLPDAQGHPGWTQLRLDGPILGTAGVQAAGIADDQGAPPAGVFVPGPWTVVQVLVFRERLRLFGWNAPDPNLLVHDDTAPVGSQKTSDTDATLIWTGFEVGNPIEIDGDHPALLPGSWLVLDQPGPRVAYEVMQVESDGAAKYALNGPITRTTLVLEATEEAEAQLAAFDRRRAVVHAVSVELAASEQPDDAPLADATLTVAATDPPLPAGRRVVLIGTLDAGATGTAPSATSVAVSVDIVSCTPSSDTVTTTATMTLVVSEPLPSLSRQGLVVRGNVATATHGETVHQVLGSGDGRTAFPVYRPRRAPLTFVRASTPQGARAELVVRVDGVQWTEVDDLLTAGPTDRVYVLRHEEDGGARIVLGDGRHGARPATGVENIVADHRVGIGEDGAVAARSVSLLVRRPLGIREVTNPAGASDWAPAETLEEARVNAPLRIRTLDRAVSVADHVDFARGYAGVGPARADLLWDGRSHRVLVSVLGALATAPSTDLVDDLHAALDLARDPGTLLEVRAGQNVWFGVRVEVAHDPAYERAAVLDAVQLALSAAFGSPVRDFATPVSSAAVLLTVRTVAGVTACTVPRLFRVADPPPAEPALPDDADALDVVGALPGRWDGAVLPAQLLALAPGAVELGEMTP